MAAAQLAGSAALSGGLSSESSKLYFLAPNSKGFRCLPGKRRSFDGGRAAALSLSLGRAKLSLPCPIMRRRKAANSRMNSQLSSDCSVESDDVEETVALKQESHPSHSTGEPKYDLPSFCLTLHLYLKKRKKEEFLVHGVVALNSWLLVLFCANKI